MSDDREQRKLAAIMFTDMVGYSALSQHSESLALELLEEHRRIVRGVLPGHRGREVKTMGDGFLLEFPSALSAVQAGVDIQRAFHDRNQSNSPERRMQLRIGIHVGDVVQKDGDIHGDGVNIAARLEPLAMPGGICVSEDVARAVRNKISDPLAVLGPAELKNIALPMQVCRVVMPWEAGAAAPVASRKSTRTGLFIASALLLASAGLAIWRPWQTRVAPATTAPHVAATTIDKKSVAVLAFANLSEDKNNEYFSDGVSEELLNVLAKIPGLKVSARTSAFFFKGKQVPIADIAKQLGVAYVVEGSVRKSGDRLRITAQLINAADGFHVWSDNFDRDAKDVFAVQDEIAGIIARNLSVKLDLSPGSARTVNPEAHRLLLEGRHFLALRNVAGFAAAEVALTHAVELDPQFAPAQAALAEMYALRSAFQGLGGGGSSARDNVRALAHVALATQLDPTLAEPYAVKALILTTERKLAEAEAHFQQTFRLNPNYAIAHHWHANLLFLQGRIDDGLVELEQAVRLNPLSYITLYTYGAYLSYVGRLTESLVFLERSAALREDVSAFGQSEQALALLRLGRKEEAVAMARAVLQSPVTANQSWSGGDAVYILRQAGFAEEANRSGNDLMAALPAESYLRGHILCALGRFDEGLPLLASSPFIMVSRIALLPIFDPVRDTPRFKELIVKLGAVEEYRLARETLARMQKQAGPADSGRK
jgi:adenylate cyclase